MSDTILNLDALLDQSMEEVAEAPNYVQPETGVYVLTVVDTSAQKNKSKDADKPDYVTLHHVYRIDGVEQQEGMPIAPGSLFTDRWMAQDKGLEFFKTRFLDIAEANGEDRNELSKLKLGEMLEGAKGMTFKCVIAKVSRGTDDKGVERFNTRINNIVSA